MAPHPGWSPVHLSPTAGCYKVPHSSHSQSPTSFPRRDASRGMSHRRAGGALTPPSLLLAAPGDTAGISSMLTNDRRWTTPCIALRLGNRSGSPIRPHTYTAIVSQAVAKKQLITGGWE
ncbi:unnamed protein product [Merluccius merluccius]